MIYLVTDGNYFEYEICGVFSTLAKAEKFKAYHNYSHIKSFDLDPPVPDMPGALYTCLYIIKEDDIRVTRTNGVYGSSKWVVGNWETKCRPLPNVDSLLRTYSMLTT